VCSTRYLKHSVTIQN